MSAEILIVDDSEGLALNTAEFVENKLRMPVAHAITSRAAIEIVEQNPVAVVVLDQRMEGDLSGTDLFLRLTQIKPRIRAIMLTGQAEGDEVGQALRLGFRDYLPKSRIAELPVLVLRQYLQHETETSENGRADDVLIWPPRPWLRPWRRYEIRLKTVVVVDGRVVDPLSWQTLLQINAGEERKLTRQLTSSRVVALEESSQKSLKASLALNNRALVALTSSLEHTLASSLKTAVSTTQTAVSTTEQLFKLPTEPGDTQQVFVRARLFQAAPITHRIVVTVLMRCRCCDLSKFLPLVIVQETGLIATRHQDYMSDGSVRIVETGDVAAASAPS
jgi:CheY-like chemotaxis protein